MCYNINKAKTEHRQMTGQVNKVLFQMSDKTAFKIFGAAVLELKSLPSRVLLCHPAYANGVFANAVPCQLETLAIHVIASHSGLIYK